jgi:FliI/YscN family ATPase
LLARQCTPAERTNSRAICEGRLVRATGTILQAELPQAAIGDLCTVWGAAPLRCLVIGFTGTLASLAPFDHPSGLSIGAPIVNSGRPVTLNGANITLGRLFDGIGEELTPNSGCAPQRAAGQVLEITATPPHPLTRRPISEALLTGIRPIDTLTPIGYGQRLALIAEAGVGKSTLLGMIAERAAVDVAVIGLIGERGREVNEFIDGSLGTTGRRRSILVVSTSDETPLRRVFAPLTATRIAEFYRSQGKRVLLLIDSLTRYARAVRDLGLARGELPVRQGLTPSIYTELPRLFERAGNDSIGSITALYTVLAPRDGEDDALIEEVKSLLDGHIVLSNELRNRGFQPAIDPTRSISRLAPRLLTETENQHARTITRSIYRLLKDRELIAFGGTPDLELAAALRCEDTIGRFMHQSAAEIAPLTESRARAASLYRDLIGA